MSVLTGVDIDPSTSRTSKFATSPEGSFRKYRERTTCLSLTPSFPVVPHRAGLSPRAFVHRYEFLYTCARALEPSVNATASASRSRKRLSKRKLIMQYRHGIRLNFIRATRCAAFSPGHDPARPILSDIWGTLEF